jgi:hypothetical protein
MNPIEVYNSYNKDEKGYVSGEYEINIKKEYLDIKCLYFFDIYGGINYWSSFNKLLKTYFPNLEVLFVKHNYTLNENKDEFTQFMEDPWLKKIFIYSTQDKFSFKNTPTRLYHDIYMCKTCSQRKYCECDDWKQSFRIWEKIDKEGVEIDNF